MQRGHHPENARELQAQKARQVADWQWEAQGSGLALGTQVRGTVGKAVLDDGAVARAL